MLSVISFSSPTTTSPKSSSVSSVTMYGYLPIPLSLISFFFPPENLHSASCTNTPASIGKKLQVIFTSCPGLSLPLLGRSSNGANTSQLKSAASSPSFTNKNSATAVSLTALKPKSRLEGLRRDVSGRVALTRTKKLPMSAMNSITSVHSSLLVGRKVTSIFALMPGLSLICSGNFIEKIFESGSLYLIRWVFVREMFFSVIFFTYSPPVSHPCQCSSLGQSKPKRRRLSSRSSTTILSIAAFSSTLNSTLRYPH
mmetsp:Transcript_47177/g.121933  ORF Transcript_47177/g.121933 Transcript_47177/m.121933 type:complete len:255 (+) Transcript_47177:5082-5846(+)